MGDFETQVREYWSGVVAENPVPSAAELMERVAFVDNAVAPAEGLVDERAVEASPSAPRKPFGRSALAAVAAAIVILVGSLVWLFGSSDETSSVVTQPPVPAPSLPEPTNTTPATSTIPATTTAPAVLPPPVLEASRVPQDEAVFGDGQIRSVAVSESGLVAVGMTGSAESRAVVWVSTDGSVWTRLPDDESVFGDAWLGSVASYGEGFVAVGNFNTVASVWMSPDGVDWERVPHDESVFGRDNEQSMVSVVEFNGGLVAVGGTNRSAAVWASPNGLTWTRVGSDEPIFEGSVILDIVRFGEGLVAVGLDSSCCEDTDALVWTSADGVEWERVPHDETVFGGDGDQIMTSVASSGGRLVAVGLDHGGLGDSAVWRSEDGLTWTRVPDESVFGAGVGGGIEIISVEALGEGFVAGGLQHIAGLGGDMDAVVWTTSDGLTWARVSAADAVFW